MRTSTGTLRRALGTALLIAVAGSENAHAASFRIVHVFTGGADRGYPAFGNLVRDGAGNLYGAMAIPAGFGSVYKMSAKGAVTVLYTLNGRKGAGPNGVILDKRGNLWGTACCGGDNGCGVVFKLTPKGHETLVHSFAGSPGDGCGTYTALTIANDGSFYGVTQYGGKYRAGTVFSLTAIGAEKVLHSFKGGRDGSGPLGSLLADKNNNLYGTTAANGGNLAGTAFRLTTAGVEKRLYTFKGSPNDGATPTSNLIMDASGNLFGETQGGGRPGCEANIGCGTVFKLTTDGTESILHFFKGGKNDGANPFWGMIADDAGNLYGTTQYGGGANSCNGAIGCGTVFEIAADGTETVLHTFNEAKDGANPVAGLTPDGSGHYYGATSQGGQYGYGTVFEISP